MYVLVIEDDESVRTLVVRLLEEAGHVAYAASDGKAAMELLATHAQMDLAITDILMPVMEGLETIRALRRHHPQIRILAISGGGQFGPEYCLDLARRLGAHATLQKPFVRRELLEALARAFAPDGT